MSWFGPNKWYNEDVAGSSNNWTNEDVSGSDNNVYNEDVSGSDYHVYNEDVAGTSNNLFNEPVAGSGNNVYNEDVAGSSNPEEVANECYGDVKLFEREKPFPTFEDMHTWVVETGLANHWVIVKKRTNKTRRDGFTDKVWYECDRSGVHKSRSTTGKRHKGSKKCDCPFSLIAKYSSGSDTWSIRVGIGHHNHPPADHLEGHAFAQRLTQEEHQYVVEQTRLHLKPHEILAGIKDKFPKNMSTLKTIQNARLKIRREENLGKTPMQILFEKLQTLQFVYETRDGADNVVEQIFFMHPASWKLWRAFPHVIYVVESTTVDYYRYNFSKLLDTFNQTHPGAVKYVCDNWLEKYRHMFVSCFIDEHRNFGQHTTNRVEGQHAQLKRYISSANTSLDKIVDYVDQLVKLQLGEIKKTVQESLSVRYPRHDLFVLGQLLGRVSIKALDLLLQELNMMSQLNRSGNSCRHNLQSSCGLPCSCTLASLMLAGAQVQLESIDVFWRKLDLEPALIDQEDEEVDLDEELDKLKKHLSGQPNQVKKSWISKIKAMVMPSRSEQREPKVQTNPRGRPSGKTQQSKPADAPRHSSYVPRSQDETGIPPRHSSYGTTGSFLRRSDLDPAVPVAIQTYLPFIPPILHPYVGHIQDVLPDGHCGYRSFAVALGLHQQDWPEIRARLYSFAKKNQGYYEHLFGDESMEKTFEAIKWDHPGPAPVDYWMTMPICGYLVADYYAVVVHYITPTSGCSTIFPSCRSPQSIMPHRFITVAFVNGNHFVMVRLIDNYPMPPPDAYTSPRRNAEAANWVALYRNRIDAFITERDEHTEPPNIINID